RVDTETEARAETETGAGAHKKENAKEKTVLKATIEAKITAAPTTESKSGTKTATKTEVDKNTEVRAETEPDVKADYDGVDVEVNTDESADEATETADPDTTSELVELVILPGSMLIGRSASDLRLRSQYQINLLAISRQGKRLRRRPRITPLRTGDVLLLQGPVESTAAFAQNSGCAPLATRELRVPNRRNMGIASAVMGFAVISAALGWWSAALSFVFGILLLLLFKVIAPRNLYRGVDWSVVV